VDTPALLELAAHGVTATLATWLGLLVVTRARRQPAAGVFGVLCLYLFAWSAAVMVQRLTTNASVIRPVNAVEDVAAFLLPAGTLHIALTLAVEGRRSRVQQGVLAAVYLVCAAMAAGAVIYPDRQFAVTPPHFEAFGIPGAAFGWAWIAARVLIFLAALGWILAARRQAGSDLARRRQLQAAFATVTIGAAGGVIRFLPGPADSDPWIGVSLVTLAMVMAAYAVLVQGLFLAPQVAARAFRYTLGVGLGVTAYIAALLTLESLAQRALSIDVPILTGTALVVTIALFDPVAAWLRRTFGPAGSVASDRLLRALGQDMLSAQPPAGAVEPALARLVRSFRLSGAQLTDASGAVVVAHGTVDPVSPLLHRVPLRAEGVAGGFVTFGAKRSRLPFTHREAALLDQAAGYLAAALGLAERHDAQAEALETLGRQQDEVRSRAVELNRALTEQPASGSGLHVYAMGPLRVERSGVPVQRWGGAKAGSRQAEAVFAFLFDRGERGAGKDEMVELIWPDVDLERADLAFHRTLGGLRTTLEPGRAGRDRGAAISFRNDRYRLDPSVVEWSDVAAFDERIASASAAGDPEQALLHLERARSLYRGDYLDDCPFYGDSAFVEDRRDLLRGRLVDLLLTLGERYAQRGDRPAAAACFRQARMAAGEELPAAESALEQLGSAS
jgi:DNA-binding SARP family transcriptional activator